MFEGALGSLEAQIPDLAEYSEKIQAYVDNIPVDQLHLAFFPNGMDTPEKVQEGVRSLYAIVRMREQPMQAQQQVQQQMQQNAFTQSRQGVVDTNATDYDAKINDAILNA
jgi:NADH:ubiquinone oxidoreductase subunit B-like Fe-S oxidoreductase